MNEDNSILVFKRTHYINNNNNIIMAITFPHISGHQFIAVIDAGDTELPLADKWEIIRVGGDEKSFCWE